MSDGHRVETARRVLKSIRHRMLADTARPPGCAALKGEDCVYRVSAGGNRTVYEIRDGRLSIHVVGVGHRRAAYR